MALYEFILCLEMFSLSRVAEVSVMLGLIGCLRMVWGILMHKLVMSRTYYSHGIPQKSRNSPQIAEKYPEAQAREIAEK